MEKKEKYSKYLCGFRRGRSTIDALSKVTDEIEKAINIVVYFDIEKAFDTVCREGLLAKAFKMNRRKERRKII